MKQGCQRQVTILFNLFKISGKDSKDPLYTISNYLLGFRRILEVDILLQKNADSVFPRKIGISDEDRRKVEAELTM